jgi:cytochrome d ubiquinol oxidase subunit II
MLMPWLARDNREKRIMYNTMGPFWDGNEVWLITAGGVTFAAFPKVYAVMFSTLYTPLMLILFGLILRGISFEFRSKENHELWHKLWDTSMFGGSLVTALLFGVAFANIFRGIPFDAQGNFEGTILTLLNPYGIAGGVLFILLFLLHGSLFLPIKSEGELAERSYAVADKLWPVVLVFSVVFLVASWFMTPLWKNYLAHPWMMVIPLLAVVGLIGIKIFLVKREPIKAWLSSGLTIGSVVFFGVGGIFPNLYPSLLDASASLTCYNASSSLLTLKIMFGIAIVTIPFVIVYQTWVYHLFNFKVTDEVLKRPESY